MFSLGKRCLFLFTSVNNTLQKTLRVSWRALNSLGQSMTDMYFDCRKLKKGKKIVFVKSF